MADKTPFKGENPCPCKRKGCPRFADCDACYQHHHLPGKTLPTTCERIRLKQVSDEPDKANGNSVVFCDDMLYFG